MEIDREQFSDDDSPMVCIFISLMFLCFVCVCVTNNNKFETPHSKKKVT